jgi:hypothetical protein
MTTGTIILSKLIGKAAVETGAVSTLAEEGQPLLEGATLKTDANSSAIIAFSNGTVVQISGESEFGITTFKQNPFTPPINLAALVNEPTVSQLVLHLDRGDAIVRVKHLRLDQGSTFTLRCPGGAAGVRGTTFRMDVRPAAKRTVDVTIDVMDGNVTFAPNGQPSVTVVPARKYLATLPVTP